jgi:hypothetical protein
MGRSGEERRDEERACKLCAGCIVGEGGRFLFIIFDDENRLYIISFGVRKRKCMADSALWALLLRSSVVGEIC